MEVPSPGLVTKLLLDWRNGDSDALNRLMPLVYDELRRIAIRKFQQYGLAGELQPTALVHEAYMRLIDETKVQWQNRAHFYAIAANTIRRILVEDYRKMTADKRGGIDPIRITLASIEAPSQTQSIDIIALNEALEKLESLDQRQASIIEMRFFGGLNNDEIAEAIGVSRATVEREWRVAKAWLYTQLADSV